MMQILVSITLVLNLQSSWASVTYFSSCGSTKSVATFSHLDPILRGFMGGVQLEDDWILIQRHVFTNGNAFKNKLWRDYKHGFSGGVSEYWLGLDKMYRYTKSGIWHLKVEMTYDILGSSSYGTPSPRQGQKGVGEWDFFSIGSESGNYKLKIGKMFKNDNMGTSDPMQNSNNAPFSSSDRDHDTWRHNCAARGGGGWWFYACFACCGNCVRSATRLQNWWIWYNGLNREQVSEMKMWIKKVM